LCPAGWHAPSDSEFTALSDYLGGYLISGGKLKETGTAHWLSPNTGATNSSGFTALPGGLIWEYSWAQGGLTSECIFWTSTAMGAYDGSSVLLVYDSVYLCTLALSNRSGASVRCLCDSAFNSTESIPSGEEFRIFPNPANDNITIASPENAALEITDINGQTLMHTTIQKGKTDIDISRFAKGIYIMRWQNNNKTEVSRFLKE
ncbi:MAG: FISUMP domain-containing protein, partial [Bacteroidota bacterium]